MANGSSRVLAALVTLVVGFAIGWLVSRTPQSAADDQLIRVHGDGSVSKPRAHLKRDNVAAWTSDSGSLAILFPEKNFPGGVTEPPFEGMTHQGTDWAVQCNNSGGSSTCFSGKVNGKLPRDRELEYKYDQVVGGTRYDGMIIIER